MLALMKTEPGVGHFALREVDKPSCVKDDDVLIRVRAAGVCGTDVHIYHDKFKNFPPVILGHEFSGVIEGVGAGVKKWNIGDRVVGEPHTLACGVCEHCRQGKIQICDLKRSPGWGINGAFTDYLIMPERLLHKVPDNVSDEIAALCEPMAIITSAVLERGRVESQDIVAVVGSGPIGLLSAFVAKAGGARKTAIFGLTIDEELRFPVAQKIGIDYTVNVEKPDEIAAFISSTGGRGADLVVEASGSQGGINTAIELVRKCGRISVVGMTGKDMVNVAWDKMVNKVCDVFFNLSSSYTSWDRALSIMASTPYDLSCVITHMESIENWEKVFDDIGSGKAIKALFVPEKISGHKKTDFVTGR